MKRVASADYVRNFSEYSDYALREPVIITRNGRDRLAVVNVEHLKSILQNACSKNLPTDLSPIMGLRASAPGGNQ